MTDADTYDTADYYDATGDESTVSAIRARCPLTVVAYSADEPDPDEGLSDDERPCHRVGERVYTAEEVEQIMRAYAPEWFDDEETGT